MWKGRLSKNDTQIIYYGACPTRHMENNHLEAKPLEMANYRQYPSVALKRCCLGRITYYRSKLNNQCAVDHLTIAIGSYLDLQEPIGQNSSRKKIFGSDITQGRKKYTPPPWKPSSFFFLPFSGSEALWCIPFLPDLWCIPFPLFSQENGIHHGFFCSVTSGSGDRPRKEGCHGGGQYALFFPVTAPNSKLLAKFRRFNGDATLNRGPPTIYRHHKGLRIKKGI